ncbi:hypothetical protein I316_00738 [Kwoniella heveanensis BCC8398]|uniref:Uncharacterized protein n=1 Tax=Kwoniella heveanensis BCC8398 TaxID=1296120 RepID=A0A1B9H2W2_9TREE|nr:hypothetical protein I316_00738 [Kwoniella heveanensis BCC8398]
MASTPHPNPRKHQPPLVKSSIISTAHRGTDKATGMCTGVKLPLLNSAPGHVPHVPPSDRHLGHTQRLRDPLLVGKSACAQGGAGSSPKRNARRTEPYMLADTTGAPSCDMGIVLREAIPCVVSLHDSEIRFKTVVRYIGQLPQLAGPWLGVLPAKQHSGAKHESGHSTVRAQGRHSENARLVPLTACPSGPDVDHQAELRDERLCLASNEHFRQISREATPLPDSRHIDSSTPDLLFVRPHQVVFVLGRY